jgi:acylphosphatase
MRFIAKKLDNENFNIIALDNLKTLDDKEVEVIVASIEQNKERLEKILNEYQEETDFFKEQRLKEFTEQRDYELKQLKQQLEAINNCKEK